MDFELHPTITLRPRSFNVLVAPREVLSQALNHHLGLRNFSILYVSSSGVFDRVGKLRELEVRGAKASRALKKEDQVYGQELAEMAKKHSSEAFYALDDPLEAAVFSVLVEPVEEASRERGHERVD
jgi:hypothetical protein